MTDGLFISGNARNAFNIPIAPEHSCSDKCGMNNKAIKLKLLCFYTCILTSNM